MRSSRRGAASVEYMLLVCSLLTVTCLTAYFLKDFAGTLVDKVTDKILDAAFALAL